MSEKPIANIGDKVLVDKDCLREATVLDVVKTTNNDIFYKIQYPGMFSKAEWLSQCWMKCIIGKS